MEILNSSGEVILRPVAGEVYTAGEHEIEINLLSVPSGAYRLRVRAGEQVETRALVVSR